MQTSGSSGYVPNVHYPEIMRGIMEQVLAIGDVLGHDGEGRIVLAIAVESRLFDERTAFGTDVEDVEAEPEEDDEAL